MTIHIFDRLLRWIFPKCYDNLVFDLNRRIARTVYRSPEERDNIVKQEMLPPRPERIPE